VFSQIYDTEGLNLTGRCITSDYYAYLAGIRQFMNPEAVDINVFATPGIDYVNNTLLVSEALTMIEEDRGDALYIMTTPDKPFGSSDNDIYYPEEVVENFYNSEIDSSYAATYYPWVKYYDDDNKVYINLPATKDVVRSLAYTDNISYPWFAPAGIIRGGVECEKAHFITKLEDEDILYEGSINPIKTFATDGVKIWGQKTMYSEDTPLNRINIRRLMLRVKKLITGACRRLIFEQNDATVKTQFEGLVKPILDDIKAKRGIFDYRLEVDDSAEARDRMELPAVIYIKPVKTLEYISLTFVITPEAAKFDDI
jgi:phage tail sheath protein FI